MLRAPDLDAAFHVRSQKSRAERENHFPHPAAHISPDAAQDEVGFLDCECTLLGYVEPLIHQHPQLLPPKAAPNPFSLYPVCSWINR